MDTPPTAQPVPPKLPWSAPTVTRVPIVARTQQGSGIGPDGGGFDDTTGS
jgi:hypothetical protein